jgi:hypothetical protein
MTTKSDRSDAAIDSAPSTLLLIAATASLIVAGLSLAAYALAGFATPDWTVAGPGLLVAAAGVGGIRNHWFYLAGLIPLAAIVSIAAAILAYDLARPEETLYLVGAVTIIVGGCLAAVFGTAAAIQPGKRGFPLAALTAFVAVPLVGAYVVASNPASAAPDDSVSPGDRAFAVEVEMIDYFFVVDPALLQGGEVVHLRNTGTLPHDFTIPELDVAVYLPPGRDTYLHLPRSTSESFSVVCTVGDHADLGMRLDVAKLDDT